MAGEQGVHALALAFVYVPKGHVVAVKAQVVAPWGLKDPAVQGTQAALELAPGVVE